MMTPRLSILIPSIPSRWQKAKDLYEHIMSMVGDKDVEVLLFMDNKKRSIGEKREALKNMSNGKYFMFVDDDDSLYSLDEIYNATANDVDVITFKSKSRNADGSTFIVTFGLKNEIEHNTADGRYLDCKRPPFTQCAWASRFKIATFPASNYGEDGVWVELAMKMAFIETHIPLVLHGYNFDPAVSEAVVEPSPAPQPAPKPTIVNVATHRFHGGQLRLKSSLLPYAIDFNYWQSERELGAPLHTDNPYAFKIYAIEHAWGMGYDKVLWLDASVYAVKDPSPVFDWITKHGVFMEEAGHYVGQWCNDQTLEYFAITREQAMTMPMFSAGFVGFDFSNPIARQFFDRWKESMLAGMFKGDYSNHRHDMTCGSIIANKMKLPMSSGGQFFAYIGQGYGPPSETAIFHLQGI